MKSLNLKLLTLLKTKEITTPEFLILSFRDMSGEWPNPKLIKKQVNISKSHFYKVINNCKYIWEKEINGNK